MGRLGGLVAAGVVLVLLALLAGHHVREQGEQHAAETAATIAESEAFAEKIRCIEDETWMLTAPEALEAETQLRLAEAGLPHEPVEPEIRERLAAARKCTGATP